MAYSVHSDLWCSVQFFLMRAFKTEFIFIYQHDKLDVYFDVENEMRRKNHCSMAMAVSEVSNLIVMIVQHMKWKTSFMSRKMSSDFT